VAQLVAPLQIFGQCPQRRISVDELTFCIGKQRTICVPIKGDTEICAFRDDFSKETLNVQ